MKQFNQIKPTTLTTISTGIQELDQFLSIDRGILPGYIIFLTGSSGAGKTSLTKLLQRNIKAYKTAMLQREVSADLLAKQLLKIDTSKNDNCFINDSMTIQEFLGHTAENNFKLIVIDSLQRCRCDFSGMGEKAAHEEIYKLLRAWTTVNNSSCIIIGQSNKDGSFNGNNANLHMFDCHLEMIYNPKKNLRYMVSTKNRMGGTVGSPLFYRFTETQDILEFNTVRFTEKNIDILDQCIECVRTYLQRLKRTDPTLFKQVHPEVIRISCLSIPDVEMLSRIISCIHTMESARNMKKVA